MRNTISKHLFNGYTFLNEDDDAQTMLVFYTDKVVVVDTDDIKESITISYNEFVKQFAHHNIWDVDNEY